MNGYVRIPETAFRIMDGSEVMYLIPMWWADNLAERFVDLVETEPTREFYAFVADLMNKVLDGGKVAPEVEPAVMNLIDDRSHHRTMALRAGDYLALQHAFRAGGYETGA